MIKSMIRCLLSLTCRVTGTIACIWPILLVAGINSSDPSGFVHRMVVLLVFCLVTCFTSLFISLVI